MNLCSTKLLQHSSVHVTALLTSDDVAIAILVAVLFLLRCFPGGSLSLCQGLNTQNHFIFNKENSEVCMHIWLCLQSVHGHMESEALT